MLTNERKETAARFWQRAREFFAEASITVTAVMTDNGSCYRSDAFAKCLGAGVKHRFTRPYLPKTNGKVERFNRTLAQEWGGIARKLTAPIGPRDFDLTVRGVEQADGESRLVLDRTQGTEAQGVYNLWFERGGWVQLGSEVDDRGPRCIARTITGASDGFTPRAGDLASWSGIYYASPAGAGFEHRDNVIVTPVGHAPAWRIVGDLSTWAIHVHRLGSSRAGTLRGVQVTTDLGYTSLVVTYRNDGDGPCFDNGRSTLGVTEVEDIDAAIGYDPHRFAVDSECAGDRAHRYATAVKFHCFSGFVDRESVLAAHNVVPGEMFRDGCTVHTILLSQVSDAETSEVIGDKPIYFCRGEKGLRFSIPHDAGPSHVLNGSVIGPLRHPVGPSFPARNQRFWLRGRV